MTIADIRSGGMVLLDCVSGSRAYGLHTPQSDTDLKGVFLLPRLTFYGLEFTDQVNNESNDEVYYELRRFVQLLTNSNPNILELLYTPEDCIRYRHPVMDMVRPEVFLSKQCKQAFAGYAQTQIKKASGLNKKILNPVDRHRKTVQDFCYVVHGQGAMPLVQWLAANGKKQEDCGLVAIDHMRDMFALFHNSQLQQGYLRGITSGPEANDVSLSPVPKGISPLAVMTFNKDGYSKYCKDYKEYWQWVEVRNDARYENTLQHGKNYDAKNMMHTFRLLNMAEEIATMHSVNVRRPDRDFLLSIKAGDYDYATLVEMANEKLARIDELYQHADLPAEPDKHAAENMLAAMRHRLYNERW